MNKNTRLGLLALLVISLLVFVLLNVMGVFEDMFDAAEGDKVQTDLMIDFVSVQTTIRAVQSPEIPNKQFVETIDTLTRAVDVKKLRNPFRRVIRQVEIKPKVVPKQVKKPVSKPTPQKTKKRIIRPKIQVNGIIWDRSNPYAILDGEIYGEGDYIKGYTIQTIVDTLIVLYNDDDVFTLNYEVE